MSAPKVEKEEVLAALKEFPPIDGRLNARNIHEAHKHIINVAERFPSDQAPEFGHRGLVEPAELYALVAPNRPWVSPTNPGPHRPLGLTSAAQRSDADVVIEDQRRVYDSSLNVHLAGIAWLNITIPRAYRPNGKYNATQSIIEIFAELRRKFPASPDDKKAMEALVNKPWIPANETFEECTLRLEDAFEWMVLNPPALTEAQLVDKALTAVKQCGLFETAVVAWTALADHSWQSFKNHFGTAVSVRMESGMGTAGTHNYVNNTQEAEDDDSSIESIRRYLGGVQLANNTNVQTMNNNLQQVTAWQEAMSNELARINQALAALPTAQPTQYVLPPAPLQPNYALQGQLVPPPPPQYPTTYQQQYYNNGYNNYGGGRGGGRGRGRGGRRGGRNRGGRGGRGSNQGTGSAIPPPAYPPAGGGIPPPAYGIPPPAQPASRAAPYSNTTKYYNNHNMCYSCGFDVPIWHTSMTCPQECRKSHHQVGCNETNWQQYEAAGHNVSKKARHKIGNLPTNPTAEQA